MQYRVFYSWQSDLPNATNRSFIETALNKAAEAVAKDATIDVDPVIDRDTAGTAGSPDISSTIFEKIQRADAFVADVSIVSQGGEGRPSPNPNVLIELGYVARHLGWEKIVMVMNTAFGKVEDLPFDLRMRRVMSYRAQTEETDRSATRNTLTKTFEGALRLMVEHHSAQEVGTVIVIPTPLDAALAAIESGAQNQRAKIRDFWKWLLAELDALAPEWTKPDLAKDELLWQSIYSAVPRFVDFVKIVRAAVDENASQAIDELGKGFEGLIQRYHPAKGFVGSYVKSDFDFYSFIGHELFTSLIAVLLEGKEWTQLASLFEKDFIVDRLVDRGQSGVATFRDLSEFIWLQEKRRTRLGVRRLSLHADLLREIHSQSPLSEAMPFDLFQQADYLAFLRGEIAKSEDDISVDWRPWTSIFLKETPRFLVEAMRKSVADELVTALSADNVEQLKQCLQERSSILEHIWREGGWDIPVSERVISAIGTR